MAVVIVCMVQLLTGLFLSILYDPNRNQPATVNTTYGENLPAFLCSASATVVIDHSDPDCPCLLCELSVTQHIPPDTIALAGEVFLWPISVSLPAGAVRVFQPADSTTEVLVSRSMASVYSSIKQAPGGLLIRSLHRLSSGTTIVLLLLLLLYLAATREFLTSKRLWVSATVTLYVFMVMTWTGHILPGDAYSVLSESIVSTGLGQVSGGRFVGDLFGLNGEYAVRTYLTHVLYLPLVLLMLYIFVFKFRIPRSSRSNDFAFKHFAVAISLAVAVMLLVYVSSDVSLTAPVKLKTETDPRWPFIGIHYVGNAVGEELLIYAMFAFAIGTMLLPLWVKRTGVAVFMVGFFASLFMVGLLL